MKLAVIVLVAACAPPGTPLPSATPAPPPARVETPGTAMDTAAQLTHQETATEPDAEPGELHAGQILSMKLGDQHATETQRIQPPTSPPAPPAAERLLVATGAVVDAPPESSRLVGALQRLADALALVAPQETADIARIRESAAAIERATVDTSSHAADARAALAAAGDALRALPLDLTTSYGVRLRDAADIVAQKAAEIDPATPLDKQYAPVREALRASTDAVYSVLHEPPPVLPGSA